MKEGFLFMLGAFACTGTVLMTLLMAMFLFRVIHGLASKIKKGLKNGNRSRSLNQK